MAYSNTIILGSAIYYVLAAMFLWVTLLLNIKVSGIHSNVGALLY